MVTFTYQTVKVVLPSPELHDAENLGLPVVIDRAKSGAIYAFKKLSKPITKLSLVFQHVNRPKILEVINLLQLSAGNYLTYKDHRNVVWSGKILNSPFEATHAKIRNNQFTIEFEGAHA